MWECQVPTVQEENQLLNQERLRRVSRPMVNALGESVGMTTTLLPLPSASPNLHQSLARA